jgi:signal transduction histidine kinase
MLNGKGALLLPVSDWGGFVVLALGLAVPWWAGLSSRNRRRYLAQLEQRARDLELGRAREAELAAARERARITRELHDVVAHNVTVMVIQAQGVQARLQSEPAQAQAGLDAIVATGREALVEIRRLLGVVREDTEEPLLAPEPGVDQLPALVEQLREAGVDVGLSVEGVPQPLPAGVGLTAYRIVQESLTNALRHSVAEIPPRVRLRFEPHQMSIVVESSADPAPQASAGIGLAGMRERARLVGGQLLAGPTPEGGYRVQARLPLDPA